MGVPQRKLQSSASHCCQPGKTIAVTMLQPKRRVRIELHRRQRLSKAFLQVEAKTEETHLHFLRLSRPETQWRESLPGSRKRSKTVLRQKTAKRPQAHRRLRQRKGVRRPQREGWKMPI